MILAIETATARMSVALRHGNAAVAEIERTEERSHDAYLAPALEALLRSDAACARPPEAVAVSAGPGSFTGLRIGMAAAKGVAIGRGIPLVAVPTFDAAARFVADRRPEEEFFLVTAFDARRADVYFARFRIAAGRVQRLGEARAAAVVEAASECEDGAWLCGDGAAKLATPFPGKFRILSDAEDVCHASAVAIVGADMLLRGEIADPSACEPIYLGAFRTTAPTMPLFGNSPVATPRTE